MQDEHTGILHVPLATTSDGIFWRGRFGLRMSERCRSVTISSCPVLADTCYMYSLYNSTIIGRRGGTALSPTMVKHLIHWLKQHTQTSHERMERFPK